jgi:hypothetical protein
MQNSANIMNFKMIFISLFYSIIQCDLLILSKTQLHITIIQPLVNLMFIFLIEDSHFHLKVINFLDLKNVIFLITINSPFIDL